VEQLVSYIDDRNYRRDNQELHHFDIALTRAYVWSGSKRRRSGVDMKPLYLRFFRMFDFRVGEGDRVMLKDRSRRCAVGWADGCGSYTTTVACTTSRPQTGRVTTRSTTWS
jgi:hypothetical protein